MTYNIMIVDDEESIVSFIKDSLNLEGFNTIVAYNGREAIEKIDDSIHLIVLDIKIPYMDGFSVAKHLSSTHIPIIFLTAKDSLETRLKCFSLGAKDYLSKPFYMEELIIRIKNILNQQNDNNYIQNIRTFKDLTIDYDAFKITINGNPINLTRKEFEIIKLLSLNSNYYFSKDQIYDLVNLNKQGNTQVISEHIRKIRKKLSEYSDDEYIDTKWGVGYRWLV
ncbi:DNA-binding response regulator [Staphylococcus felis]|uniref:DNA-binding response regulator n=3 Tax=Staphylococcus felis TaxID=46127 RepID=A0A2K3Z9W1_9STAP|nr:response regulator transcription factor [Staphylococcus felis]AVP36542.1 DNA-binding response regulator [Staphylococcus felis]PNZ34647.1 DNA-binding response regulator [Staphylococcus felis]REH76016.1 DNA-binding response regulator [Staphylococcus felis]REH79073.1 DNA-binding response regulator [Staphylococcus felis]REH84737.1 DNA-binding response regulator [Staphylococcus felis]